MPLYDAFISYSHAKDKPIAASLQSVIQKLGKPWYKRRALRVFRDDTSLSATPHLWPSIEKALAESRYLILLASPEAAASPWIAKEVSYWLANKSPDTLFIGLTHGELAWNAKSGDFDWSDSTPLPDVLKGRFASEPKWVDLRVYRDGANPRNAHLIELGADFAAAIRGMPKEDLLSQEVRQQRRSLTLAMGAAASLLVLAAAAAWQWRAAETEKTRAEEQLRQAQINQSKFLEARAREAANNGDVDLAKTLLSMSMPTNFREPDRPLVATKNAAIPAILERDALVAILHGHKRAVDTVAFSPDGKRAITASWDDTIRIWNAATGEPLLALPRQELQAATLSPDASQILTTEDDFKARLWDATSGKLLRTLTYGDEQVSGAAFSPDGKLVFTTLHDGRTRIWDLPSGQSLHVLDGSALAFSHDSRLIVAASSNNIARIWDVATGQVSNVLRLDEESESGARHWITTAVFSSDGTRVLAASDEGALIWEASTGQKLHVLRREGIQAASFSPDGKYVLTLTGNPTGGWSDHTAQLWDADTGALLWLLKSPGHDVDQAVFSPDGARVATGSSDGTVQIWNIAHGELVRGFRAHSDGIRSLAFNGDGSRILTGSYDGTARVWEARTGEAEHILPDQYSGVQKAAFSTDGTQVLTVTGQGHPHLWDTASGALLQNLDEPWPSWLDRKRYIANFANTEVPIIEAAIRNAVMPPNDDSAPVYSADGKLMLMRSKDKKERIWDVRSRKLVSVLKGPHGSLRGERFSPDAKLLLTIADNRTANLWDVATGEPLRTLEGHDGSMHTARFSPDGNLVLTSSGWTASIWDANTGKQLHLLAGHANDVMRAEFSPDGKLALTSAQGDTARIWDTATGELLRVLEGHQDDIYSAAFSPDGTRIVTASRDNTARIWDAATGDELQVLRGHEDQVMTAVFSPDSRLVLTGSDDETVRIWRVVPPLPTVVNYLRASISWLPTYGRRPDPAIETDRARTEQGNGSAEDCDALAGDPFDPAGNGPGVIWERLRYEEAIRACGEAVAKQPDEPRLRYELGRAQEWYYRFIDDEKLREKLRRDFEGNYRAAIAHNYSIALYAMAKLEGTSLEEAISLLQRADENGVTLAARALSQRYAAGEGATRDMHEALRWLERGAAEGDPWAHADLGRMYWQANKDYGIDKNWALALFHFTLAVRLFGERGYADSEEISEPMLYRANLARRLPMDRVAEIWEAAQAWKAGEPVPAFGPSNLPTPAASPRPTQMGAAAH